ncbi:hypothetical protein HDU81_007484 [Chytriomyces hyalinus]|nr:hypothetical protein HDU81_007484 [Chytriomyces hyalinus]
MSKIKIVMFNDTNHHDWEFLLLFFLKGKDLASTLMEDIPEDSTNAKAWTKINQQAFSKIGERVNLVFHKQLRKAETARELFDAVKKILEASSTNVAIQACCAFTNLKYEDSLRTQMDIMKNYDKFKTAILAEHKYQADQKEKHKQ